MLITTSRNPSHFLRRISKIITLSLPNSQRFSRGSLSLNKIFRYCWNQQISRLLILQKDSENTAVLVKAYSIGDKHQAIKAIIRLTKIISLQKHDKAKRIMIEKVELDFTEEVNKEIKDQLITFFSPIVQNPIQSRSTKILTIRFEKWRLHSLIGYAIQKNSVKSLPLYIIHISSECINNAE